MSYAEMSTALRRYVVAVAVLGPLLAVALALRAGGMLDLADWGRALVLALLAAVTYGRPLRLSHKSSYDVSEVVHVAMVLLFPAGLPGLLVLLAGGVHLLRSSTRSTEEIFNVSQVVTYVTAGAFCLAVVGDLAAGPALAGLPPLGAILASLIVMLLVNSILVAGVIAVHTKARFLPLWRAELAGVVRTYAALVALGVVVALVVRDYPLALIPRLLPVGLAQYALRREVQLRADTRAAVEALANVIELRDP